MGTKITAAELAVLASKPARLRSVKDTLNGYVTDLEKELTTLLGTWKGDEAALFGGIFRRLLELLKKWIQILEELAIALEKAIANLEEADQIIIQNTADFTNLNFNQNSATANATGGSVNIGDLSFGGGGGGGGGGAGGGGGGGGAGGSTIYPPTYPDASRPDTGSYQTPAAPPNININISNTASSAATAEAGGSADGQGGGNAQASAQSTPTTSVNVEGAVGDVNINVDNDITTQATASAGQSSPSAWYTPDTGSAPGADSVIPDSSNGTGGLVDGTGSTSQAGVSTDGAGLSTDGTGAGADQTGLSTDGTGAGADQTVLGTDGTGVGADQTVLGTDQTGVTDPSGADAAAQGQPPEGHHHQHHHHPSTPEGSDAPVDPQEQDKERYVEYLQSRQKDADSRSWAQSRLSGN